MPSIVYYRSKCIGCGTCYERQPELWRMSKKDGKATLLRSVLKKNVYVLAVSKSLQEKTAETALVCPVKIIKVM